MAEGGIGDFGYEDSVLGHRLDHDDDDDDDEQEVNNKTQFFLPGLASTPYDGKEMQTIQHEKTWLPDDFTPLYEETPLLGVQSESQSLWEALMRVFPEVSATYLESSYTMTGRLQVKM